MVFRGVEWVKKRPNRKNKAVLEGAVLKDIFIFLKNILKSKGSESVNLHVYGEDLVLMKSSASWSRTLTGLFISAGASHRSDLISYGASHQSVLISSGASHQSDLIAAGASHQPDLIAAGASHP